MHCYKKDVFERKQRSTRFELIILYKMPLSRDDIFPLLKHLMFSRKKNMFLILSHSLSPQEETSAVQWHLIQVVLKDIYYVSFFITLPLLPFSFRATHKLLGKYKLNLLFPSGVNDILFIHLFIYFIG